MVPTTQQQDSGKTKRFVTIDPEVVQILKARGGRWGVYENQVFDSGQIGHIQLLRFGEGCTHVEAPACMPDTAQGTGWKYRLIYKVEAKDLADDGVLVIE